MAQVDISNQPRRSGKIALRIPAELHDELADEAERQGVSLNSLIQTFLAGAIGWRKSRRKAGSHGT